MVTTGNRNGANWEQKWCLLRTEMLPTGNRNGDYWEQKWCLLRTEMLPTGNRNGAYWEQKWCLLGTRILTGIPNLGIRRTTGIPIKYPQVNRDTHKDNHRGTQRFVGIPTRITIEVPTGL